MNINFDIHLLLVSAQPIPNITPVLDERFRPKTVIMLVSPDMQPRSAQLEKVLTQRGIKVIIQPIADAWDIEAIRDVIMNLLGAFEQHHIVLNVTGGTKPMAIAAYEVFRAFDKPIFYVHPEQNHLVWMYPQQAGATLHTRLDIEGYLQAYGGQVTRQDDKTGVPRQWRDLTATLVTRIADFATPISTLNYLAVQAKNPELRSAVIEKRYLTTVFYELLDLFQQQACVHFDGQQLFFKDEDSRLYACGGWLEQHVYGICLNIKQASGIRQVARNIEVTRPIKQKITKNELDVAFIKVNRLYLLECKTKRYASQHPVHDQGADPLYKLDSLADLLGGLQAKAMLVSYNTIAPHNLRRAEELKIRVCQQNDLKYLAEIIQAWACL